MKNNDTIIITSDIRRADILTIKKRKKQVRFWNVISLQRPWCWERLKAGEEGDDRGWDGWMASLTQWTWVWASSGSWWWTEGPGGLHSMRSQSQKWLCDWTELNWSLQRQSKLVQWLTLTSAGGEPWESGRMAFTFMSSVLLSHTHTKCIFLWWNTYNV